MPFVIVSITVICVYMIKREQSGQSCTSPEENIFKKPIEIVTHILTIAQLYSTVKLGGFIMIKYRFHICSG